MSDTVEMRKQLHRLVSLACLDYASENATGNLALLEGEHVDRLIDEVFPEAITPQPLEMIPGLEPVPARVLAEAGAKLFYAAGDLAKDHPGSARNNIIWAKQCFRASKAAE